MMFDAKSKNSKIFEVESDFQLFFYGDGEAFKLKEVPFREENWSFFWPRSASLMLDDYI